MGLSAIRKPVPEHSPDRMLRFSSSRSNSTGNARAWLWDASVFNSLEVIKEIGEGIKESVKRAGEAAKETFNK